MESDTHGHDTSANRKMWTNEEISSIIHEVRMRPFLYDKKHSDYKQHQKKESAWDMIAASLNNTALTARECKRKWNTLRIQKRRILNQQSKRGKGKHTVLWQFFDALDFLMPHMEWIITKNETSDAEFEETFDHFEPEVFEMKKTKVECDLDDAEDETDEHFSDDQQMEGGCDDIRTVDDDRHIVLQTSAAAAEQQRHSNEQQKHMNQPNEERLIIPYHEIHHQHHAGHSAASGTGGSGTDSVVSPTSSSTEIIRLIHPGHGQATSVTTSDGQTVYMTPTPTTQQQLISITHPVALTRFSGSHASVTHLDAHMSTVVDSSQQSSCSSGVSGAHVASGGGTNSVATLQAECPMTPTHSVTNSLNLSQTQQQQQQQHLHHQQQQQQHHHQQQQQSTPTPTSAGIVANGKHHQMVVSASTQATTTSGNCSTGGGGGGLNYFLLDIQMQMEKLSDIAQMEVKVEMQKLLLDKLRHPDNYKLSGA